nr:ATP-binding cassette domain-containing protein [Clostridium thermarum]
MGETKEKVRTMRKAPARMGNSEARLLFRREDLNKKVELLSGGERVKGALAKIMVGDFNVLILDEPTNYLDIYSLEAVEEALRGYGTQ